MAETHRFRSALGGFNREDVVRYIEYLNNKHTDQVNQLTSEVEFLRQQLEQAQSAAPVEAPAAEPTVQNFTEAELEAYRRAERMERSARERAEQIYRQATGTLADATALVDDAAGRLGTMADSVKEERAQLRSAIETSKASLKDAAAIMSTIRPEGEEE